MKFITKENILSEDGPVFPNIGPITQELVKKEILEIDKKLADLKAEIFIIGFNAGCSYMAKRMKENEK